MANQENSRSILSTKLDNISFPSHTVRRGRKVKEDFSVTIYLDKQGLEELKLIKYRDHEYHQYKEMLDAQKDRFFKYYKLDKFSRRLLIQFPADWYENKNIDYMPCPESFLIQYVNNENYNVIINMRSSEISRVYEDLAIIRDFCITELLLEGTMNIMSVHFMNIHRYEEGSSEDYDAKKGYFDKK